MEGFLIFLGERGIEPRTLSLRGTCSNQLSYSPIFLLCIILTKAALQLPASAGLSYSPIVYREVPYIDSKKKINRIFVFTKKHIT